MADRKFFSFKGAVVPAEAEGDYEAAQVFDKVRVGRLGVYYRDGFRIRCVPYAFIDRVFIRIQEVRGRMCCGQTTFAYFRLVFVKDGKELGDVISESEEAMDAALAKIGELAPQVATGFVAAG